MSQGTIVEKLQTSDIDENKNETLKIEFLSEEFLWKKMWLILTMQKAIIICLKSELSGIDIFIVRHDDPASEVKILLSMQTIIGSH